jgi:hypothetical protein
MSKERLLILSEHFPALVGKMALNEGISIGELRRRFDSKEYYIGDMCELVKCPVAIATNKFTLELKKLMEPSK